MDGGDLAPPHTLGIAVYFESEVVQDCSTHDGDKGDYTRCCGVGSIWGNDHAIFWFLNVGASRISQDFKLTSQETLVVGIYHHYGLYTQIMVTP